jgi:hypothetical protein
MVSPNRCQLATFLVSNYSHSFMLASNHFQFGNFLASNCCIDLKVGNPLQNITQILGFFKTIYFFSNIQLLQGIFPNSILEIEVLIFFHIKFACNSKFSIHIDAKFKVSLIYYLWRGVKEKDCDQTLQQFSDKNDEEFQALWEN